MSQFGFRPLAGLAALVGLESLGAAGVTIRRPGGDTIELSPWELEREESKRHAACNVKIMDAEDPDFSKEWLRSTDQPVLIKNLIGHWPALEKWTPEWYRNAVTQQLLPSGIKAWNFSDAKSPQCLDCTWAEEWGLKPHRSVERYFEEWNARLPGEDPVQLKEPNAIIFTPDYHCLSPELNPDAPLPEAFAPFCGNRHIAFAAFATSHGFHRHSAAWQAQVAGYKSWYLLPGAVYTQPKDVTTAETPFGFPHEKSVQEVNSICGYKPTLPEVREQLINCVQGPGEAMYVPNTWWHATCSLDDFSVGTGGGLFQGQSMKVVFKNTLDVMVMVLYLEGQKEMHLENIKPNQEVTMKTHKGHIFRLVRSDNGMYLEEFVAPGGDPSNPYVHHIASPFDPTKKEL